MIDVAELFRSQNGTQEELSLELESAQFPDFKLLKPVSIEAKLMRLEEGILFSIESIETEVNPPCVRCSKAIKTAIHGEGSSWLFHEEEPVDEIDPNEQLRIDCHRMQIDPREAIRQELDLLMPDYPRCEEACTQYEAPEEGVKALSDLKDLL